MKSFGVALALMALGATAGVISGCSRKGGAGASLPAATAEGTVEVINTARFSPPKAGAAVGQAYDPAIVRLQVLLDRARFSPGVIDGRFNENTHRALNAYESANGLKADGILDREVWDRLTKADQRGAMRTYVIDPSDVAGPFTPHIPQSFQGMSRLESLGFRSPAESLSETFHMDPQLFGALNPKVAFHAGQALVVADRGADDLGVDVALVEVDHAAAQVRAFGADHRLLAVYPATVGSQKSPPPVGVTEVASVEPQPTYLFEKDQVAFGRGLEFAPSEIAPGPNNPVGAVWIETKANGYGIHGTPEPQTIGRAESSGCIRMANWDVVRLSRMMKPGFTAIFQA